MPKAQRNVMLVATVCTTVLAAQSTVLREAPWPCTLHAIVTFYAMPGTALGCKRRALVLRACYAMSGTDTGRFVLQPTSCSPMRWLCDVRPCTTNYELLSLRVRYALSGTDLGRAALPDAVDRRMGAGCTSNFSWSSKWI
eukprot:1298371-Rhodomonas_salina.3